MVDGEEYSLEVVPHVHYLDGGYLLIKKFDKFRLLVFICFSFSVAFISDCFFEIFFKVTIVLLQGLKEYPNLDAFVDNRVVNAVNLSFMVDEDSVFFELLFFLVALSLGLGRCLQAICGCSDALVPKGGVGACFKGFREAGEEGVLESLPGFYHSQQSSLVDIVLEEVVDVLQSLHKCLVLGMDTHLCNNHRVGVSLHQGTHEGNYVDYHGAYGVLGLGRGHLGYLGVEFEGKFKGGCSFGFCF